MSLNNVGWVLNELGESRKALPYWERALAMRERLYPKQDHKDLAMSLGDMGLVLQALGESRKALPYWERALAMRERLYPKQDQEKLAASLHNMGAVLQDLGEPGKALPYCERALAMSERLYPKQDHPDLAGHLNNMGLVLKDLGELRKALPYSERALAMYERLYPKQDHKGLAASLNSLGNVLKDLGEPRKALPYYERALAMYERLYPKQDRPDLAGYLNNMGGVLQDLDEPGKALPYHERALAMSERLYPKQDHKVLAMSLDNMGVLLKDLGEPGKALPYSERGLAMRERLYPERDHKGLAMSLNNMGVLLRELGEPGKALPYSERALAMSERLYPKQDHNDLAMSLGNMGLVLQALGEPRKALPYYERALAVRERLYPKQDHPYLAASLNNMGNLLLDLGEPRKALPYYERALTMYERLYPKQDHKDLAASLDNMGLVLQELGEPGKALPYCERALAMSERLYPKQDHKDLAASLNNMGILLGDLGEPGKALSNYERALAIYERLYPKQDHPDPAGILHNMGIVLQELGEPRKALSNYERALAMRERLVADQAAHASEAEALAFAASHEGRTRDRLLSLCRSVDDSDGRAYAAVWGTKAAITRVLEGRHLAARAAQNSKSREAWLDLADTRRQLARLLLQPARDREDRDKEVNRLTARKEKLERDLAALLPALRRQQELDRLGPEELGKRLPAGAAFLDFTRYRAVDFDPKKPGHEGTTATLSYAAFVLVRGRAVKRVELGPAAPIDGALDAWRRALEAWRPDLTPAARRALAARTEARAAELRRLVWDRVAEQLPAGTTTLYLSPDGDLARLPWAALPTGKADKILLDDYLLAVVPHGPFLLARLMDKPPAAGTGDALVVYGGIDYGTAPGAAGVRRGTWPDLPGTERERQGVTELAEKVLKDKVVSRTGRTAETAQLLADLPKARYAHLATHGFFDAELLTEERRRLKVQLTRWEFQSGSVTEGAGGGLRSPLAYTGVVLAGANAPDGAGADNGIATGEALVELPLEGLRLCVLSACETGLGELTEGEGVHGLVRAFHLAGCPDVVASLWQVNDRETVALMEKFYYELWVNKRPPIEALREAQLLICRRPDLIEDLSGARGVARQEKAAKVNASEAPPGEAAGQARLPAKYWAAFVLSGGGR
jgi:tetratricopeptide (TPR) repeat protein